MTKTEIIQRYVRFNQWVQSLESLSDAEWVSPIKPGKWSVAEIITHITYWDRYFLKERYPKMQAGARLQREIDVDVMNQRASLYAKSGVSKKEIIKEFLETRDVLIKSVNARTEKELDEPFYDRGHLEKLRKYLINICEHDRHHKYQIEDFLRKTPKVEKLK